MKKGLSILLSLIMITTIFPINAIADEIIPVVMEYDEENKIQIEESKPNTIEEKTETAQSISPKLSASKASLLDSGYCGGEGDGTNVSWCVYSDGRLVIRGEGKMGSGSLYSKISKYKDTITSLEIWDGITSIGDNAFDGCSFVKGELVIPYGVTSIGKGAFDGCSGFTGTLIIPDSVEYIGSSAFQMCKGFSFLKLPVYTAKLKTIEKYTFNGCSGFLADLIIPASVTSIGECAFKGCSGFSYTLKIPNYVKTIGNYAFAGCSGMNKLELPDSLVEIGSYAFYSTDFASRDGKITIPESVTKIGHGAFGNCEVDSYYFEGDAPAEVSPYIGGADYDSYGSFDGEDWIYYPTNNPTWIIENGRWNGCYAYVNSNYIAYGKCGDNLYWEIDKYGTLIIDGTGDMYDYKYESAPWMDYSGSIDSLVFEEGITSIGECAFSNLTGIRGELTLPNGIVDIGDGAFYNCTGLSGNLTIPETVNYIGALTFNSCGTNRYFFEGDAPTVYASDHVYPSFDADDTIYYPANNSTWVIKNEKWNGYNTVNGADGIASGYCGGEGDGTNLKWILMGDGTLIIRGKGKMADYTSSNDYDDIRWTYYKYKSELRTLVIEEGVTNIGNYAFYGCKGFTGDLVIPDSVTSIGNYAFYGCEGFTGDLVIPDNVTSISEYAFNNVEGITGKLVLGSNVKTIGASAFGSNDFTGNLVIPNSVTSIGAFAFFLCDFTGSLVIPDSVTYIGGWAFSSCVFTGDLVIPDSVTYIGDCAFESCYGLNGNLVIGDGVTEIGSSAFEDCNFCGNLVIGNSVSKIGSSAFINNNFTGSLVIPDNVISIGYEAFYGCEKFTGDLVIGDGVTEIGSSAFEGCTGFTGNLVIGNSVTNIDLSAFKNCNFTGNLIIPDSVIRIGVSAFEGCERFTGEPIIGNSVTDIGADAFKNCQGFDGDRVVIPKSVNYIGSEAFLFNNYTSQYSSNYFYFEGDEPTIYSFPFDTNDIFFRVRGKSWEVNDYLTHYEWCGHKIMFWDGHFMGDWYVSKEPLCFEPGESRRDCDYCYYFETEAIDPIGNHTEVIDEAIAPTCTETGLTEGKHCSVCNAVLVAQTVIKAKGHTEVRDKAVAPTCTETGLTEGKHCSVCNAALVAQTVIKAKGHTEVRDKAVAPTCTETGLTEGKHCSVCNAVLVAQTVVHALGHNYETVATEPTCTEQGFTTHTCKNCGDSCVDSYVEAKGHIFGEWETVTEPTAIEPGEERRDCKNCDTYETQEIPAKGYAFGDVNLDEVVDVKDVYFARLIAAKLITPTNQQLQFCDVDGDGRITAIDANLIRKFAAKIIDKLPVEI